MLTLAIDAVAVNPAMLFGIGSNSKAFISTTILSLVDAGKVKLDDPLSVYLPTLNNITMSVTIRQLLNMTSGLFDYLNDSNAQGDAVSADRTLSKLIVLDQLAKLGQVDNHCIGQIIAGNGQVDL